MHQDPQIKALIEKELVRQAKRIELIAFKIMLVILF